MRRTIVLVVAGAVAMAAAAGGALALGRARADARASALRAAASTRGPAVSIRLEGTSKTLLLAKRVRTGSGSITKYGAPSGKCPARSAQGALNVATHGHWKGTWSSQFNEYFITSIKGEKPSGHDFWEIFVNNKAATKGACDLKLHRGEQLLFVDESGKEYPSALNVVGRSANGHSFTVKLLGYNAQATSKPLAGVRITGNGVHSVKTNAHGEAEIQDQNSGTLILRASPKGYVRSEATVHVSK